MTVIKYLRYALSLPCFLLSIPSWPAVFVVMGWGFSAASSATKPVFGFGIDVLLVLMGLPSFPFFLLGMKIAGLMDAAK